MNTYDNTGFYLWLVVLLLLLLSGCSAAVANPTPEVTDEPTEVVIAATETATSTPTSTPTVTASPTNTTTPLPTAQLPAACSPRTDWPLYTIAQGDTLGRIAQRVGSTVNALAVANCITNPNTISAGQQIRVPRLPVTATATVTSSPVPPADEWITQGSIHISSYITADAGNYQLRSGETITLRWDDAPAELLNATFYMAIPNGSRTALGTDTTPNDGLSIQWTVPGTFLDGRELFAEGNAVDAAAFDYARSLSQTIYVPQQVAELTCPAANSSGQGIVSISGADSVQGNCQILNGNRTVTLTWDTMPNGVNSIEYYVIRTAGSCNGASHNDPDVVTSVNDVSQQGNAATWSVNLSPCAGIVYAFGYTDSQMVESQQRPFVIR